MILESEKGDELFFCVFGETEPDQLEMRPIRNDRPITNECSVANNITNEVSHNVADLLANNVNSKIATIYSQRFR